MSKVCPLQVVKNVLAFSTEKKQQCFLKSNLNGKTENCFCIGYAAKKKLLTERAPVRYFTGTEPVFMTIDCKNHYLVKNIALLGVSNGPYNCLIDNVSDLKMKLMLGFYLL